MDPSNFVLITAMVSISDTRGAKRSSDTGISRPSGEETSREIVVVVVEPCSQISAFIVSASDVLGTPCGVSWVHV
jgi:hypothetical protein